MDTIPSEKRWHGTLPKPTIREEEETFNTVTEINNKTKLFDILSILRYF